MIGFLGIATGAILLGIALADRPRIDWQEVRLGVGILALGILIIFLELREAVQCAY